MKRGMKRVAALLMAVTVAMVARAAEKSWDVVVTSRDEKIECTVVEVKIGESVRLRMKDGQEMTLPMSEVKEITPRQDAQPQPKKERKMVTHSGISCAIVPEMNGGGDCSYRGVGIQAGYRPIPGLFVGAGVMPSSMSSDANYEPFRYNEDFFAMPVYGVVKYDFVRRKASPFLSMRLGAMMIDGTWMLDGDKVESGFYFNGSVGVRVAIWKIAINPYFGGSYVGIDAIRDRYYIDYKKTFCTMGVMLEF